MTTSVGAMPLLLGIAFLSGLCRSNAAAPAAFASPNGSWVLRYRSSGPEKYHGLSFPDPTNGWMVGDAGKILHTRDGGSTWEQQASPYNNGLRCVQFVNAQVGWAAGVGNAIVRTRDGGHSWILVNTPSSSQWPTFMALHFVDEQDGWLSDNRAGLLHTQDGGKTWIRHDTHAPDALVSLCFLNKKMGWSLGLTGTLLQTVDGGQSWSSQRLSSMPHAVAIFSRIFFLDDAHGWIGTDTTISSRSGDAPPLFRTTDGGRTWSVQGHWPGTSIQAICFENAIVGRCAEFSGVYATRDGGITWAKKLDSQGDPFVQMALIGPSHGWVLTFTGKIYAYSR